MFIDLFLSSSNVFPGAVLIYWVKLYILCFSSGNRNMCSLSLFLEYNHKNYIEDPRKP